MTYSTVFTFNKKHLSHCFKNINTDINTVENSTILFSTVKDYINVPEVYRKRTIIINNKDILELSMLNFKETSVFKRNKILRKLNTEVQPHLLDIKFIREIIENPKFSINDKFHFTLVKGLLKKLNHISLSNKNNRRITTELYFKMLNIITHNSYNRKRFNTEMKSFLNSTLVYRFNNVNFDIAKNDSFEYLHTIYSTKVILKTNKFNRDIFLNNCIMFSYSKPLIQDELIEMRTTISQDTICKYYNISQSSLSNMMRNKRKLYKYEIVSKEEYIKSKYNRENGEDNSYVFPIKTFSHQFDFKTDTTSQDVYYIKSLGSRLFSSIYFKSIIKVQGKVLKLNNLYQASGKSKKKHVHNNLQGLDNNVKYNLAETSNVFELIDIIQKKITDTTRPKHGENSFQSDFENINKPKKNLTFQLVSNSYSKVKEKLITFINTLSYIKSIKNIGLLKDKNFWDFKIKLSKQFNISRYLHQYTMSNLMKLKNISKDSLIHIKNMLYTNHKVYQKYISKINDNINNWNNNNLLDMLSNAKLKVQECKVLTNQYINDNYDDTPPW